MNDAAVPDAGTLERRAVVAELLAERGDLLVVTGLGAPNWDVAAAGDHEHNLPLWGGMGGAAMVGLGVALAQPTRRVLVVTGDGEQLMGLTALSTIGAAAPVNLAIAVLDNECYGETGCQPTNTSTAAGPATDLAAVAAACGFPTTLTVRTVEGVARASTALRTAAGPALVVFKVAADMPPQVSPLRDGRQLVERFRRALGVT